MKKLILLIGVLFFITESYAQDMVLKITNTSSNKEITIKENRRIKIKTVDGKKIKGRFKIEDENTLLIKEERIALADIETIKRNQLLLSFFTNGLLIYGGALVTGIGVIIGALVQPSGFLLTIPGAAMIVTGILSPNFNRNFKKSKNWSFEIVNSTD
jgi:hypothetical protein